MTWMLTPHGGWDGGDEGIADSARGSLCGLRLPRWIGCANDQRMLRLDAPHKARAAIDTAAMACTARLRIGCGTESRAGLARYARRLVSSACVHVARFDKDDSPP